MEKVLYYLTMMPLHAAAMLPLRVLYVLSDVACFFVHRVARYRVDVVRENLRKSFPEKSIEERQKIEGAFYHHICDVMVETVKMLHLSDKQMQERVEVNGANLMEQAAAEGKPVFLFIGHIGNWEWVQEITRRIKAPTVHGELYRPMHSKVFERVMRRLRNARYHTRLIPVAKAVRTIIAMKREEETFLIGFIGDQRPTRNSLHHWMDFMNQDTPYMVGGEEIGRHVGAKFLVLHVRKPARGRYVMDITDMVLPEGTPEGKDSYPYVEMYMLALERNIKEQPEIYLWSHKRWKHKRNTETEQLK